MKNTLFRIFCPPDRVIRFNNKCKGMLALILFLFQVLPGQSNGLARETKVSISVKSVALKDVLLEIERQSQLHFFYSTSQINSKKKVNLDLSGTLEQVLDHLFEGTDIAWQIEGRQVLLKKKGSKEGRLRTYSDTPLRENDMPLKDNMLTGAPLEPGLIRHVPDPVLPDRLIKGKVTDETGGGLPGVNILIKGTQQGTVTDAEGKFELRAPDEQAVFVFSFVGYVTREIAIGTQTLLDISLREDAKALSEVVVVGYGAQRKVNLTGAVDVVSGDQLANRPASNMSLLLQGASPNVNINLNSFGGEPGASQTWQIRGVGSISGNTTPLILIDGVESNVNYLDPETVESISILKDASASAVYGSRAAFGVVLITTKKGAQDQPTRIGYNNNISFSVPIYIPDMESSLIYATAFNQAATNAGLTPTFPAEQVERIKGFIDGTYPYEYNPDKPPYSLWRGRWDGNANYNWTREYYKKYVVQQKHNINLSGGDRRNQFYINAGIFNQPGTYSWGDDGFKRYNILANVKSKVADWISFDFSGRYARTETDAPIGVVGLERTYTWSQFLDFWPTMPKYNMDGSLANPIMLALEQGGRIVTQNHDLWMNIGTEIEPVKGWKTNLYYRYNYRWGSETRNPKPVFVQIPNGTVGNIGEAATGYRSILSQGQYDIITAYTAYEKQLGKNYFKILAGYERDVSSNRGLNGYKMNLITQQVPSIRTATGDFTLDDWMNHWATQGIFGRFNYNYDEKYLLEVSGRYDGSSRFAPGQRWGLFPSVSGGYNISKEKFWASLARHVNALKLRASYGSLGNQNVANYLYLPTIPIRYRRNADNYADPGYIIGDEVPLYAEAPAMVSDNLTWETITTFDVGLEAAFLKNRLELVFDWYNRTTSDMLGPSVQLPSVLGASVPPTNNARLSTKGFELSVAWRDRLSSGFSYDARFLLSDNRTTILEYLNESGSIYGWYKGRRHGDIWGLTTDRILQTAGESMPDQSFYYNKWGPGDIVFKDLNGDGVINEGARTINNHGDLSVIANTTPRYSYGLTAGCSWRGFDMSMIWQGIGRRDLVPGQGSEYFWGLTAGASSSAVFKGGYMLDYWRPADETNILGPNTDSYFPKPYFSAERAKNIRDQSRYVLNAAYVRLKNLQVGYTVPATWLNKFRLKSARLYVSAENLLTFSRLPRMYEPETVVASNPRDGGVDMGETYPINRMFSMGVNFTF